MILPLPVPLARLVLGTSWKVGGIECRPFTIQGTEPLPSLRPTMLWLQLPADASPSTASHWAKLKGGMDLPFAGLIRGDSPGRLGVRLWGTLSREGVQACRAAETLGA